MDAIRGFVYRTIYENTQRTYCVFVLKDYNEEYITCTGKFESPKEGEDIGKIKQIIRGYDEIDDYWLLEELKKYNEEDNFDRVDSALYAIHYGTAEELSFQNKLIQVDTTPEKKDIVYKPKPQTFIKKYNTAVKKFGYNRSLL